jgi:hypothetical protein
MGLNDTGCWSAPGCIPTLERGNDQNVILDLAFAPDGRMLAVGLWGNNGIRL